VTTLRKGTAPSHVPVLLAIGKGDEEQRVWARRAGADEMLEKPLDAALLTVAVRQLIRLKIVREELELRKRELVGMYEGQRAFVEALVHDFKNPIAVVHVNLAWLADRIGAEDTELIESISDAQEG